MIRRQLSEPGPIENGIINGINSVVNQISNGFTSMFGQIASGLNAMGGGATTSNGENQSNVPDGTHTAVGSVDEVTRESADATGDMSGQGMVSEIPVSNGESTNAGGSSSLGEVGTGNPISNGESTNPSNETSGFRVADSPTLDPSIVKSLNKTSTGKPKKKPKNKAFQIIIDIGKERNETSTGEGNSSTFDSVTSPPTVPSVVSGNAGQQSSGDTDKSSGNIAGSINQDNAGQTSGNTAEAGGLMGDLETKPSTTPKPKDEITDFDDFYW